MPPKAKRPRSKASLPNKGKHRTGKFTQYEPTPAQIEAAKQRIQAEWTEEEAAVRNQIPKTKYERQLHHVTLGARYAYLDRD